MVKALPCKIFRLCQNFLVSWVRIGAGSSIKGLVILLMAFAKAASGGPPHSQSSMQNHFSEVSPLIQTIEIQKGDPFIEVFISGWGHLDCFDAREFVVERNASSTAIVPRLRRFNATRPCKLGLKFFRDKAADLDPALASSYEIEVLGYKGWEKRSLSR